ncbi:MAG: hypothetical protein AB7O43_21345 [Hyphomicrobiaceae bacterium]
MSDAGSIVLWSLAAVLGIFVARRDWTAFRKGLHVAVLQVVAVLPRIALALLLAGFIAKLLPTNIIAHMLGHDSGWSGVLLACLFGGFMPAGPMIAFPLVVVLRHADAGIPQLVAFLTAWSVFAWHRVLVYEVTMMGWQFAAIRMVSSLMLPLLAAVLAMVACAVTGIR